MSRKERVALRERTTCINSSIWSSNSENMLPPKVPLTKSKARVLANAINRDLNRTSNNKGALERQRENASKLASGRSVVDKADKENEVVRNKSIKPQLTSQIDPPKIVQQAKVTKPKGVLEERKNKIVKSESVISLYTKEEIVKVEKEVTAKPVVLKKIENLPKPVVQEKVEPKAEVTKVVSAVNVIDKEEESSNGEFLLGIYADDIHRFMKHLERTQFIKKEYLTSSHIMTHSMRSLLVDWLFEVQQSFKLLNETVHLTISLLDRFMQDHPSIPKNELQLVGVSCMFLASKYEEMYPPDLDDLVEISAKTYTKLQIIRMEQYIFSSLNYEMGRPSPAQFLRRYGRAGKVDIITYFLSKYFIDLSIVSYSLCHEAPSLMAASALCLALYVLSEKWDLDVWTPTLVQSSDYSWDNLKPVVRKLAFIVWNASSSKYQAVKNKYLDPKKTYSVSTLPELKSEKLFKLYQTL